VGSFKPWRIRGFVDGRVRSHLVERFWGPSELTIREWIGSINTRAFVGTNPTGELITVAARSGSRWRLTLFGGPEETWFKQRAGGQTVVESLPFSKSKTKSGVESSSRAEFR